MIQQHLVQSATDNFLDIKEEVLKISGDETHLQMFPRSPEQIQEDVKKVKEKLDVMDQQFLGKISMLFCSCF